MNIILATRNQGKFKEFVELADATNGLFFEPMPDEANPIEIGSSFLENAIIKARVAAVVGKLPAVADDSGLEVDALGGAPGIHSARYAEGTDADRRRKLLSELESVPEENRLATFVCAMAVCSPDGTLLHTTEGRWRGRLGFEERGEGGFGYDPIFCLLDRDQTVAQLSSEEKHALSHRGQAWRLMLEFLSNNYFQP